MTSKKKDLEIVYSLRWRNGPKTSKQMSIISVYDIPATTLNFQVFKSYLLKNSGTAEDDVSVFYIMENGKEYPIQSQVDFQVALYAFRRKARAGEVINLLLERISDQPNHKNLRHSNDVETQFDNMEQSSIVTTSGKFDVPPEWFIAGMAQLKKDLKEELTENISCILAHAIADLKTPCVARPTHRNICPYKVRSKPEKCLKKSSHKPEIIFNAKDLPKPSKLDSKLEKYELKASKYRARRLALQHALKSSDNGPKSSDSEAGHSSARSRSGTQEEKRKQKEQEKCKTQELESQKNEEDPIMDARPVNEQTSIPHMLGGEVYLHQWEVQNTGQAQWSYKTQLQYTWGSKKLVPVEKTISVPFLKPGEKGTVSVRLQIPDQHGKYECYWQFTHKGRRFGHWLGVQVIVDSFDLKGHSSVLEKTERADLNYNNFRHSLDVDAEECKRLLRNADLEPPKKPRVTSSSASEALASFYKLQNDEQKETHICDSMKKMTEQLVKEVSNKLEELHLGRERSADDLLKGDSEPCEKYEEEVDSDCSWNSEPTHFWCKSSKDEFFVVPVPQCFVLDTPDSSDNNASKKEDKPLMKEESTNQREAAAGPSGTRTPDKADKKMQGRDHSFDDNNNTESASGSPGGSIKLRDEELDNIVVITVPKDEQVKEGFIYVHVDGQKVLIPKNILKTEVVTAAQELENSPSASNSIGVIIDSNEALNKTPVAASTNAGQNSVQPEVKKNNEHSENTLDSVPPKTLEEPMIPHQEPAAVDLSTASRENMDYPQDDGIDRSNYFEANNYMSHCSAAGSCYSEVNCHSNGQKRMFVFPQNVPGYEVLELNHADYCHLPEPLIYAQPSKVRSPPSELYNIPQQHLPNPFVEAVPNYQQTPPEMRRLPVDPAAEPLLYGQLYPDPYLGEGNPSAGAQQQQQAFQKEIHHDQGAAIQQAFEEEMQARAAANRQVREEQVQPATAPPSQENAGNNDSVPQVHILPETLVSGAVNVASSAISTARSVINMMKPQAPGRWVNGHWISASPETPREANLHALAEMGFWNRDLNATLLARFNDDLNRVVAELVQ